MYCPQKHMRSYMLFSNVAVFSPFLSDYPVFIFSPRIWDDPVPVLTNIMQKRLQKILYWDFKSLKFPYRTHGSQRSC